jgi:hypothetical protein
MASENQERTQSTDIYTPAPRPHDTTLTAPADRIGVLPPNARGVPNLTHEQTQTLVESNIDNIDITIPRLERRFCYSAPENRGGTHQNYGIFVFVPAQGSQPDSDGIYGMIKLAGNYEQLIDAEQRAENIIADEDSYNRLRIVRVGQPSLVTVDSRWNLTGEEDCIEVDLRRRSQAIRQDGAAVENTADRLTREQLREARKADKKEMEEIRARAENLQKSVDELADDPLEQYTTLRGKLAQLTWTYLRTREQQEKAKEAILRTREEIAERESDDPTLIEKMRERFSAARAAAGIPENDDSFVKYINEDGAEELGF